MNFLTNLGEILCSFKLVLEGKTDKDTHVIKIRVFIKVFIKQFCFIRYRPQRHQTIEWGGIADLPLLRTLLAIRQRSWEPIFWEVMGSFVLLAHERLAAARTVLQRLLACLNFTLESEDLSFWYKRKCDFYELWQQRTSNWKPWRWVRLDLVLSMRDIYINSNLNLLTKLTSSRRSTEFKDICSICGCNFPRYSKILCLYSYTIFIKWRCRF